MQIEAGLRRGSGAGRIPCGIGTIVFGIEGLETLLYFPVAFLNQLLVGPVGRQRLFKREDVFGAIVADQAFGDGFDGVPLPGAHCRCVLSNLPLHWRGLRQSFSRQWAQKVLA